MMQTDSIADSFNLIIWCNTFEINPINHIRIVFVQYLIQSMGIVIFVLIIGNDG